MTLRFSYQRGALDMQATRALDADMAPAANRDGVIRTDEQNNPLYRARIIANEPGSDFDVTVSLWLRRPPARPIPRGALVQPEGDTTVTPWYDDRTNRIAFSITTDTVAEIQMANRRKEPSNE
jgi:hypothetical protein